VHQTILDHQPFRTFNQTISNTIGSGKQGTKPSRTRHSPCFIKWCKKINIQHRTRLRRTIRSQCTKTILDHQAFIAFNQTVSNTIRLGNRVHHPRLGVDCLHFTKWCKKISIQHLTRLCRTFRSQCTKLS
jgi:hypothetical protein